MHIDVIFDTICPWCYLGKHRLEEALREKPGINPDITWNSFLLNPNLPPEGIDRRDYLKFRFGNESRSNRVYKSIYELGKTLGIEFRFDLIERTPNSLDSHRLVHFASRYDLGNEAVESLFQAYFLRGIDTGKRAALYVIAEEIGLAMDDLDIYFSSDEDAKNIKRQNSYIHKLGINGVPAFVINGQFSISGAQESQVIKRLLEVSEECERELFSGGTQSL